MSDLLLLIILKMCVLSMLFFSSAYRYPWRHFHPITSLALFSKWVLLPLSAFFLLIVLWHLHILFALTLSACSRLYFSFLHRGVVWLCISCALRGCFRLVKEMIYQGKMLKKFPDHSSNRIPSNKLYPCNQPQKLLSPKTRGFTFMHGHKYFFFCSRTWITLPL